MAEIKTKATKESVAKFIKSIKPKDKQEDGLALLKLFQKITGEKPVMWGTSIVGFGKYHYKSDKSAQEGDWFHVGFSPRKQNLTLYLNLGTGWDENLLAKLGKHKTGMGCLFIKRVSDIDLEVLDELIKKSAELAQ